MTGLATAEYWDEYYRQSPHATFDWYLPNQLTLHRIKAQLLSLANTHHVAPHSLHLLQVGCGSSAITAELVAAGYTQLTNIDFSPNVIRSLQQASSSVTEPSYPPTVTFHCMDARRLSLLSASFHFVLDKGTLDCCALEGGPDADDGDEGGGGWSSGGRMLDEVWRVMRPGGVFMCFSVHGYEARMGMIEGTEAADEAKGTGKAETEESKEEQSGGRQAAVTSEVSSRRQRERRAWDVEYHTLAGPLEMPEQQHSYLYICTKWKS